MKFRVSLVNLLTASVAAGIVASALWAADNLTIKEPTTPSATVRSDDVGGVHYQGFKIYDGEADSATPLELTPAQDYDTGGGTANLTGFGIFLPASGGPVPGGTATAPLRVDPTGATAQPVTDNGGSLTVDGPLTDAQLRAAAVPVDSELPAGVTPADNQTNAVTIPLVGGFAYLFDGTAWDRAPGNSTDGALVNLGANNDVTVTSGTVTANQGGAPWSENITQFGGAAVATGVGVSGAGIPRVTVASDAHDAPITERGIRISGLASAAAPTNVSADQDMVSLWALRNGQLVQQPAFSGTLASTGSGAAGTGTQRVILATDQPVVPVSDNAGSLTVDGTVGVSGTVTVDTEFANQTNGAAAGTTGIQVLGSDGTNARVIKTDTGGAVQIDCESGCGGGTQFAEDAAHTTGDLGTMALAVRNDAGGALAGASGDYIPLTTDASGALRVTGGGGGTEVTEDVASAADPTGGQIMLRRRDTLAAETTTDGDVVAGNATNKGELYVKHVDAIPVTDNAGSLTVDGTVSLAAAIPAGTNNIGDVDVLTVPAPLSTAGGGTEATALRVTVANDSTGVLSVDDNGGSLTIDAASLPLPTGAATSANQTTEITALQIIDNLPLADDAAFTVATTNVAAMGCIEATDTMDAGDVGAVKCGSDRELDVDLVSAIPAGTNNIGDVDVLTVPAPLSTTGGGTEATALRVTVANDSTGVLSVDDNGGALTVDNGGTFAVQASQATAANLNAEVQGDAAHDAAVSGNPVLTGGEARTSNGTAVQNGDAVRAQFDVIGRQVTSPYTLYDNVVRGCGNATGTGDTAVIAAAGAGVRNYITTITIVNTSATATYVSVKDGTTVLLEIPAPANNGGAIVPLPVPLRTTANTAFNFASAAGVTTMRVCAAGFTAP